MSELLRVSVGDGDPQWAVRRDGRLYRLRLDLDALLRLEAGQIREICETAHESIEAPWELRCPVGGQEIWAAGVTYERSRVGRREESGHGGLYDLVYEAERPELFFKCAGWRAVGHTEAVGIRRDSAWNVPEPEVALVVSARGEIVGLTAANDMSSRSIEGENPLYLPQAKVYERSCAIGPWIVPVWELSGAALTVGLRVERAGTTVFHDTTSTKNLRRGFDDLVRWLTSSLDFPAGSVLLTGTGIVPDMSFSLQEGDVVHVDVEGVGRLTNPVVLVGRDSFELTAQTSAQPERSAS